MAATTLKAIIDRFQAVLEGADLHYTKATDEFTFDRQPNLAVNDVYRIEDLGPFTEPETLTNNMEAHVDELGVWIARKSAFDSQAERETLETTVNTIHKKIVADGPSNNYHANMVGREIRRADDSEIMMALVRFTVDFDFSVA